MTTIEVEGESFNVADHWFWPQYNKKPWEQDTLETFKNHISEDTIFVDIGAWVGATVIFAFYCKCKKIYAVEANPESLKVLLNTLNLNEHIKDITTCKNICIADQDDKKVSFGQATSSASRIQHSGQYQVTTQRLDSYINEIKEKNNLFIKIDIEGAETLIMNQLKDILKNNNKIFLSLHPPFWQNLEENCDDFLKNINVDLYNIYSSNGEKINSNEQLRDMILSGEKQPAWGTEYGNFFEILIEYKK